MFQFPLLQLFFLFMTIIMLTVGRLTSKPSLLVAAFQSRIYAFHSSRSGTGTSTSSCMRVAPSSLMSSSSFTALQNSNNKNNNYNRYEDLAEFSSLPHNRPTVQWYPGHIAKAERQLSETLKAVDVVVEVRDARACKATAHPRVGEWCAGRPRIVVLTHLDMVPKTAINSWKRAYETLGAERWDDAPINQQVANQAQQARDVRSQYSSLPPTENKKSKQASQQQTPPPPRSVNAVTPVEEVLFVNAKQGQGIHALNRVILKAGAHIQERRERRGLNPRALRVGIIGYPNVGKVRQQKGGT
jgi:hypothetical protein